jgi:uncharacterized membrane protein YwaF
METFTWPWAGFLTVLVAVAFCIYAVGRRLSMEGRRWLLLGCGFFNAVLFTVYTISLPSNPHYDFVLVTNLPLQFCSLVSVGLIFALIFKTPVLRALCYFPGALGAFFALVSPAEVFTGQPMFSLFTLGFWGSHGLNVILSVLIASLGLYKPSYRNAVKTLGYFVVMCVSMFAIDLVMRWLVYPETNYFYFFDPEGAGILVWLWNLIGIPFVYELPVVPFAGVMFLVQAAAFKGGAAVAHRLARRFNIAPPAVDPPRELVPAA